jgi:hypothetical protein
VVAGVAGVIGNQLSRDAGWAWVAFSVALILGAVITGWTTYCTVKSGADVHRGDSRAGGVVQVGDVAVRKFRPMVARRWGSITAA